MRSFILLLVCLFSLHLDAQTEFRVYQKDTEKSRYYMRASINRTKLNDILITSSASGFYIKEHDFNKLFTNHSFTKSKLFYDVANYDYKLSPNRSCVAFLSTGYSRFWGSRFLCLRRKEKYNV